MASGNCSEATVEIKIKTLDSQTYTLRVDKCVPVPELKEQIATVTGVLSEQQRLICRGRVLKDDQLLSAYHVEDGHTLHLVVGQPIPPSSDSGPATNHASSAFQSQGIRAGPSVLVGTFNVSEQGDGIFPSFNQIISTLLSSMGVGSGSEGVNLREPSNSGSGDSSGQRQHRTTLQPPVVPDSLTTSSQYLDHLRHEFGATGGGDNNQPITASHESNVQNSETAGQGGLARPASLAEVLFSTRQLLIAQVADCLSHLAQQLKDQANVMDSTIRMRVQSNSLRSGALLQNLGALLLELGRTTMTLRVGQTPADALVNAGPPVFISTSGPNPMMVQPFPIRSGTNFGTAPVGTAEVARNINVRIRTGSPSSIIANERELNSPQPSNGDTNPAVPGGVNSGHRTTAATPGNPPSIRVSEVRVVLIRTVVATVPTPVRQTYSDSSHSPMGLFYPALARVQHVNSETLDNNSDSQLSSDHTPSPSITINVGGDVDFQNTATNSTPHEAAANTQEATSTADNEGVFLSNMLRQIMPFISQNAANAASGSSGRDADNAEAFIQASESDGPSSRRRGEHSPFRPCKRQKRE